MNLPKTRQVLYNGQPAEVTSAAGLQGMLLRSMAGGVVFRIRHGDDFIDYRLRHEDLGVTIDAEELAGLYTMPDGKRFLDEAPETLGLVECERTEVPENSENPSMEDDGAMHVRTETSAPGLPPTDAD